jgi:hypothetical protein
VRLVHQAAHRVRSLLSRQLLESTGGADYVSLMSKLAESE